MVETAVLPNHNTTRISNQNTIDKVTAGCQSHEAQWIQFLRQYHLQLEVQEDSTNASAFQKQVHRFNFQDPFSVQVEEGSLCDDWYLPAYVDIQYHTNGHIQSLCFHNNSFLQIPDSVWHLKQLERLEIHGMGQLTSLMDDNNSMQNSNLKELVLNECYLLDKLPQLPNSLRSIHIKACHRMAFLPTSIVLATLLERLQISNMMLPMAPHLPSSLKELAIDGSEVRLRKLNLYLSQASRLQTLRLRMCDLSNQHLSQLWHELLPRHCPQLQTLDLKGNQIHSLDFLLRRNTTTRLRALCLEANPAANTTTSNEWLHLLKQNPELCCLGDLQHPAMVQKALDDNFARLLKQSSCPLALWPNILSAHGGIARCQTSFGRASLLYTALQGPALVERLPHTY